MKRDEAKERRRRAILDAATLEFAHRRFDEVKLEDVAARAGVGKGTLYLYFKGKEDLFVQMAVDGIEEMAARIRQITEMDGEFRDRFFLFGREIGAFVKKRSAMFRLMHQTCSDSIRKEFLKHHRQLVQAVRGLLQSGIDEGALRDDFTAVEMHCNLIGSLIFRIRLNENSQAGIELEPMLRFFWNAAAVRS